MERRADKINVVGLGLMNEVFRAAIATGVGGIRPTRKGIEAFSLIDMLKYNTPKLEHTCNGERYLTNCKACKVLSWRLNGLSESNIDMLLSTEKEKS